MADRTSPERRRLLAGVHAAAKAAGLDEAAYRAMLNGRTGKDSAAKCTDAELAGVLAHLNRAKGGAPGARRRQADGPMAGKIRALWWSLHHLGVVRDPSDKALGAYLRRVAKVDALAWLSVAQARTVVEGLKDWATRDAGVAWDAYTDARHAVAMAQWKRLWDLHTFGPGDLAVFDDYAAEVTGQRPACFGAADWTKLHQTMGARIRAAMGQGAADHG